MAVKSVTFLSSRGRGITREMFLIKSYLLEHRREDQWQFRFFQKNEKSDNAMAGMGFGRSKQKFCGDMTNAICIDPSLTPGMKNVSAEGAKIFLSLPYDYQFRNRMAMEDGKKDMSYRTLKRFTHILAGSPFSAELLKTSYQLDDVEVIEDVNLPMAFDVCKEEAGNRVRRILDYYFPAAKGKKILSILVFGTVDEKKLPYEDFDLRAFLRKQGEDWMLFTNSEVIMENAFSVDAGYRGSFAYINQLLPTQELLYVSDVLVTNNGRFAASYAARRKRFFCPRYKDTYFEKYVRTRFPELYVADLNDLADRLSGPPSGSQTEFQSQMAYHPLVSPYDTIASLLQ